MLQPSILIQGRYQIIKQIGQGGMGAVYEASDLRLCCTVALKQTIVSGERLERAFEREAQILANLRHSALPKVFDYFKEGQSQYLVMEFIPGDDLGALLEQDYGPFPVSDVLRWADQLLDALDYLHTQSSPIIHRDIKPQNLKLTARGEIILLDFGLAKGSAALQSQNATNRSILGYTPAYAPLEQIRGTGTDARSDLYSLAATIFHLLTDRPPPNALERASEMANRKPDPLVSAHELNSELPPEISSLLGQALALDPARRFKSAKAMRSAIRASQQPHAVFTTPSPTEQNAAARTGPVSGETMRPSAPAVDDISLPVTARPALQPDSLQPDKKSRRWLIPVVAMIVLLVAGGLIFFILRNTESDKAGDGRTVQQAGPQRPVKDYPATVAANEELKAGSDTYKILLAEVDRYASDKLALRFKVRVTHDDFGSINIWETSFRLLADGATLAPAEAPNEVISPFAAKDVGVLFVIPDTTKSVELQVGDVNRETNSMSIDLKARLNQPAASKSPARQYPVELGAGDEAKVGSSTYKILSAALERYSGDKLTVRFKIRVTYEGSGATNIWDNTFRLFADEVPLAPTKYPNEVFESGESKDVDVSFLIPESTTAIELQVGEVGRETNRISIDLPQ